jgi:hypothetical protein
MQFSPFTRHLIPLWSKYPPQHPVLKHYTTLHYATLHYATPLIASVFKEIILCTPMQYTFPPLCSTRYGIVGTEISNLRTAVVCIQNINWKP